MPWPDQLAIIREDNAFRYGKDVLPPDEGAGALGRVRCGDEPALRHHERGQGAGPGRLTGPRWYSASHHPDSRHVRTLRQFPPRGIHRPLVRDGEPAAESRATWNMAPTMDAPVVRLVDGERHLDALKWGLVPYFTKDLKKTRKPINARSETIAKSGMFKAAFAERRCLVPAPAYYEWRDDPDGKTPFAVARIDGDPVVFGGIWERWKSLDGEILQTFATITTDANRQLVGIQDRMPVIIERHDWPLWLGETAGDLGSLLRPAPEDVLRVWPVGKAVGNFRNDGPQLLEPIAVTEPTLI